MNINNYFSWRAYIVVDTYYHIIAMDNMIYLR